MFNDNTDMKVLLADDSVLILERLKEMLSIHRQVKIVASLKDGNEALAAIKDLKPDLAVIDINIPGLSGLKILNEVRKENKIIKIIFLTFYSADHYMKIAMQSGANYFLNKADDFEKVSQIIEDMVKDSKNANLK